MYHYYSSYYYYSYYYGEGKPVYACKRDVALTNNERKDVTTLFNTLDRNLDQTLSQSEFSALERQIYEQSYSTNDYSLQHALYVSAEFSMSDLNNDGSVDFDEFIAGITKLKNRDPIDFPAFLEIAATFQTLAVGASCSTEYETTELCPMGTTCRLYNGQYACVAQGVQGETTQPRDPFTFPDLDGGIVHVDGRRE